MARSEFTTQNLRTGAVRMLVGPSGVLVQLVGRLQRRIMARAKIGSPVDSGVLRNSHYIDPPQIRGLQVTGDVYNSARYAKAVHNGHESYVIRPKQARALRFTIGERTVFARSVTMPAKQGRPWLLNATRIEAARMGFEVRE